MSHIYDTKKHLRIKFNCKKQMTSIYKVYHSVFFYREINLFPLKNVIWVGKRKQNNPIKPS